MQDIDITGSGNVVRDKDALSLSRMAFCNKENGKVQRRVLGK